MSWLKSFFSKVNFKDAYKTITRRAPAFVSLAVFHEVLQPNWSSQYFFPRRSHLLVRVAAIADPFEVNNSTLSSKSSLRKDRGLVEEPMNLTAPETIHGHEPVVLAITVASDGRLPFSSCKSTKIILEMKQISTIRLHCSSHQKLPKPGCPPE